jgi:glycosyltransferase involved in cell wall biosynthesis
VIFLGTSNDVSGLLSDADLLISPVRYEAYGLAVQEAVVAGVPPVVSRTAGIAPILEATMPELVVAEQENPHAWAAAIKGAFEQRHSLNKRVAELGARLARRSWGAMAAEIVEAVERAVVS